MHYKTNWLDLIYDAFFFTPLFVVADSPVTVLATLHSKLATKYSISSSDMFSDGGPSIGDARARISLFSGNGTLEIRPDGFNAKFVNPIAKGDSDIIQDCILMTHDALLDVNKDKVALREETVSLRMFIELLEDPFEGPIFMRSVFGDNKQFGAPALPGKIEVVPGFQMDLLEDEQKWTFNIAVTRSYRSRKELFVSATMRYALGNPFETIGQKAEHLASLIVSALSRIDLHPQPAETA